MHNHRHPRPSTLAERSALKRALIVTALLFLAEVVGGIVANSLALLSDAAHMLTDLLALALSAAAIRFATLPADRKRSFGYYRLEILSALANGILLTLFAGGILVEAYNRFSDPPAIRVGVLAPVAAAGLLANLVSFWWLSRARGGLSTRAALWHTASDGASSALVLIAAGVMSITGWWWLDPVVSVLLAGIIVFGAIRLLRESADVLLESTPGEVDLVKLGAAIEDVEGVIGVHDLHVWSLTSQVYALSGHLRVEPHRLSETDRIIGSAKRTLETRFGITHTTLQVESEACDRVVCVLGPTEAFSDTLKPDSSAGSGGER